MYLPFGFFSILCWSSFWQNIKDAICGHTLSLLVAIPYQNIIAYYGWTFSDEITYLLRFIPLLRGGYALAIVVGWLTYNPGFEPVCLLSDDVAGNSVFLSLAFFVLEHRGESIGE